MSITGERGFNRDTKAVALLDAPVIGQADLTNSGHWINDKSISGKRQGATVYVKLTTGEILLAVAQGSSQTDAWAFIDLSLFVTDSDLTSALALKLDANKLPIRQKTEVYYSSVSLAIPTTETNLITLLKTLTPTTGTLSKFFNTTSNKLNVYDDNASVLFKLNLTGSWASSTENRSMSLNFAGTNGNKLTINRISGITPDVLQFTTYFSIDKDGNIATNGTAPLIQSFGSVFTATSILITAEQVTAVSAITPV
ncbi:hypothetical protein [Ralstonia phage Reminis]|uniref:Sf6-type phage tail needle knob domain-containing protein n=1 Tax=Ralstonia phage Reminis TaxID=2662139 RepID=A0A5Q2U799_9CAUD|nr:hypothetical protein [Ralstonia phage Reminis]